LNYLSAGFETAAAVHLKLAQEFCQLVPGSARRYIVPGDVVEALPAARSCAELARTFATRVNPRLV